MKSKDLVVLVISILLWSCSEKKTTNTKVIEDINSEKFYQLLQNEKNGILIDVRTPEETSQGHIKDATLIDYYSDNFTQKLDFVRKDVPIFVYCRSGGRSSSAAKKMEKMGFTKVFNLIGGIASWNKNNYEIVKTKNIKDENIKSISLAGFYELLNTNLPILVDFHTKWCVPCRKMIPIVEELEKEYRGKAIIIRIDTDSSKEISKKYNIKIVPTFILFKNGSESWRKQGLISKQELLSVLR